MQGNLRRDKKIFTNLIRDLESDLIRDFPFSKRAQLYPTHAIKSGAVSRFSCKLCLKKA